MAVPTYAGDREWLNARGKKSLRSARWHVCSLSLASLLLRSLALSIFSAVVRRVLLYNDLYQTVTYCVLDYYTSDLYHYQC